MSSLSEVSATEHTETVTEKGAGWFSPPVKATITTYVVTVVYKDMESNQKTYKMTFPTANGCLNAKDEVLRQVRELEMENMTMTLENAIKDTGNG